MAITTSDWAELYDLVTRYSRGLDTRDYDLVRSVWAPNPNISYDLSNVGVSSDLLTYHSADEVADDAKRIHAPLLATMHRNSNHWFDIHGDDATGRVYVDLFEVRVDRGKPETVHHLGWYDDVYVRIDGAWKIRDRHFKIKWSEGDWIGARPTAEVDS
jgi:hypothetical protein